MLRITIVVGTLLLGSSVVLAQQEMAIQQANLMKGISKSLSNVIVKTAKGEIPYNQAAVDTAINDLGGNAAMIHAVFATDPKHEIANASYASSPKVWQNKADFDQKAELLVKTIAEFKGKIKDADNLKVALDAIGPKCGSCHETYRVKLK